MTDAVGYALGEGVECYRLLEKSDSDENELEKLDGYFGERGGDRIGWLGNIGLTVWVPFRFRTGDDDSPTEYDQDEIGYAKMNGTWGIAVRHIWGDEGRDIYNSAGPWPFSDSPQELRIAAVDHIPEFIGALSKEASDTTKCVQEKTKQFRELAAAIDHVANAGTPASQRAAQSAPAATGKQGLTGKLNEMAVAPKGGK